MGLEIGIMCSNCNGVGTITSAVPETVPPVTSCPFCKGEGISKLYMPNGYKYSTDILECLDFTETEELSEEQSFSLTLILSAGIVDMSEDSNAKTKLWNLFDANSNTRTALIELIG